MFHRERTEHPIRRRHSPKHSVQGGTPTYLPVGDGEFLYLATVLDLSSRRLAGWSIADNMRTGLVTDALRTAAAVRGASGLNGSIFHSDNGAQYASAEFADLCRDGGDPVAGCGRNVGGQRGRRVAERDVETGDAEGAEALEQCG